ncbi:35dd044a-ea3b-4e31-a576-1cb03143783f [Thermothielavioides terrestris]|uniref:35dd044a-ea3b-4e31-a576-1cb03143783f n=1 Tax=Thermothielavioides terrestris TaxID=2587410 RepID=A0A446BNF7_9PEZI|nr:35dd044a-ea3b-4e31-a576-1cb03143783f [Thermothielavioides terrestris]
MRQHRISIAALQLLLALGSAQEYEFFRWNAPAGNLAANDVYRRQSPPPGYHPEFGSCGSGTTCENACGPNWISCQASTNLSLFCYNKVDLNQTCCENGSGRACDNGYYCAWQEFGGRVWCCENGQSLEECGVPQPASSSSTATSSPTSSGETSSSPSTPESPTSAPTWGSTSGSPSASPSESISNSHSLSTTSSQCPASTVTSWATTTIFSTINLGSATVTVTVNGGDCSSSTLSTLAGPSETSSTPGTITAPPSPSSTSLRPPIFNATSTQTLVTAGAGSVAVSPLAFALVLLPLLQI